MRAIIFIFAFSLVQLVSAQTAKETFNKAAQSYVLGDVDAARTVLQKGIKKYPKDKQLKALSGKVGTVTTKEPETVEKPKETPKPVVAKDPKLEATKELLYKNAQGKFNLDIEKGEKLVCMFSLTCGHCQEAYKDLCAMSKQGNLPKMYLYLFGQEFEQNYFFSQAGDCKDASVRTENYADFTRLLEGESFPRILAFKDGKIVKSWNIKTYTDNAVREFYKIQKPVKEAPKKDGIQIESGSSPWGGKSEKQPWE